MLDQYDDLPTIYIITPTDSSRITQLAALTRMRNTLRLVPKIFWIVIENNFKKSQKLRIFLEESNIPNVHLFKYTPENQKIESYQRHKPKGILQMRVFLG